MFSSIVICTNIHYYIKKLETNIIFKKVISMQFIKYE